MATKRPKLDPMERARLLGLARAELAAAEIVMHDTKSVADKASAEWSDALQRALRTKQLAEYFNTTEAIKDALAARDDLERAQGAVIAALRAYSNCREGVAELRVKVSRLTPR